MRPSWLCYMIACLWLLPNNGQAEEHITLLTGQKTGTYYRFGLNIADSLAKEPIRLDVLASEGSLDNIEQLHAHGRMGLAIVQSDVLSFIKRSSSPASQKMSQGVSVLFPLYQEEVHVLARDEIASFGALSGKHIAIGEEGSGHMMTALNLLASENITPAEIQKISPEQGIVSVLQGSLDAVIFVGGKPVQIFKNMENLRSQEYRKYALLLQRVHFLPLNSRKLYETYEPAELSKEDYHFMDENVPTISVQAALIAYHPQPVTPESQDCMPLQQLMQALRIYLPTLQETGHAKWKQVSLSGRVPGWEQDPCLPPP